MHSVELFAGCGGLALGVAQAGFEHAMVIERDPDACATLTLNKERGIPHVADWPLVTGDARKISYSDFRGQINLVSGGPPCQPFSIGGRHRGAGDARNMWPEAVRAVRELVPKAFLFENVRGLLRPAFSKYLEFLRLQLSWPEIVRPPGTPWRKHLRQLVAHQQRGNAPTYRVIAQGINTADYGAPQQRHRVIIIGMASDLTSEVCFPKATHSREALVWSQRATDQYWKRHDIRYGRRPAISSEDARILSALAERSTPPPELPWVTVRDAISDLPRPRADAEPILNHRLHPGARAYAGHTGSCWDQPAKTLKAGDHGVPGGENMLALRGGTVRYFTIREMARLQGFPDDYAISGTWKGPIRQLGNAVPVHIGKFFGGEIRRWIFPAGRETWEAA